MSYELIGIFVTIIIQGLYVAYKMGKFEEKLNAIEKKQDKHNSVITRTFNLEAEAKVLEEQIKVSNHRLDDLERDLK